MLLVLLIHYADSWFVTLDSLQSETLRSIVFIELESISSVCVNCFIIISGYFGIHWHLRSLSALIFQVIFWSFTGVVMASFMNLPHTEGIMSISTLFINGRWFVPAYLTLYVISPLLNKFIDNASLKELGKYLIIFYAFTNIMCYFGKSMEINKGMSFVNLIGLYMIGAYLKRTRLKIFNTTPRQSLVIYLVLSIILTGISAIFIMIKFNGSMMWFLNPIVVIMSIYLFLLFKRLNIGEIKIINYISASAFAVYLFHMHPDISSWYFTQCRNHTELNIKTLIWLPVFFASIFLFCIVIDRIRIMLFNLGWNIFNRRKMTKTLKLN